MDKSLILERLRNTLDKLKTLPESQFSYDAWVTEYDQVNHCGTVCCVLGWYPKWFPESEITWDGWELTDGFRYLALDYHGISQDLFALLFTGLNLVLDRRNEYSPLTVSIKHNHGEYSSLPDVIKVWECVIDLVETEKLNDYLIID